jgi:transcriptional regulator with GAF, ATPase, and Fis domain
MRRFELADGGTIFLDEIGDLPADAQAKLLRVLQEHEFDRVGGKAPIQVDVRVIAATNRDLLSAVREKKFREALFYRLNVFPIQLPPLRERTEDIPLLLHFMVNKFAIRIGKRPSRGNSQRGLRCVAQWSRNKSSVLGTSGTRRSLCPLPRRTCTSMRPASMSPIWR